jgi:hypothetical protein
MLLVPVIPVVGQDADAQSQPNSSTDAQQASGDPSLVDISAAALQQAGRRVVYGATFTEGYLSSTETSTVIEPTEIRTTSTWIRQAYTAVRPFFLLDFHWSKARLTLQSSPVITYLPSRDVGFGINGFLDPKVGLDVELSPRLLLTFSSAVSYGDQLTQVLVLLPPSATSAQEAMTHQANGTNDAAHALSAAEFAISGQMGLQWRRTRRQDLSFVVGKVYSTSPWESVASRTPASNLNFARGEIAEHITESSNVVAYSQVHQIRSATYQCVISGGGLGFRQAYGRFATLSVEAGPEYGNRGCNSRLNAGFSVALQRTVSQRNALSVAAVRDVDTFYAPGNNWVTTIGADIYHRTSYNTSFDVNGGYLQGSSSYNLQGRYAGYFVTPRFLWRITTNSSLTAEYGHVSSTTGSLSNFNRDSVTVGVLWHPNPKSF